MEAELRAHLVDLAQRYAAARGIEMATVAQRAAGDWRFFDRLETPKASFTVRKYDDIVCWFSQNWPEGVDWPVAPERPAQQTTAAA